MKKKEVFIIEKTTKRGKSLTKPLYLMGFGEWTKSLDEAYLYGNMLYASDAIKNRKETCKIRKAIERIKIIIK